MKRYSDKSLENMTKEQAITEIGNNIYEASRLFVLLEIGGKCKSDGQQIRQQISKFAQHLMKKNFIEDEEPFSYNVDDPESQGSCFPGLRKNF